MATESTSKKPKKGSVSEEDISTLLQRYSASAVLSLLREVANFPGSKIDWKALVKNTATGISNAREYQMLWRHLAYCDAMIEKLDGGAEPLDDDSDLEFEVEAYPAVSNDASAEAASYVKVLIAYGLANNSIIGNNLTVEAPAPAPLTINVPNGQSSKVASENKKSSSSMPGIMNITVPVSAQRQPQPLVASAEALDGNANIPPRKRRKAWSKAEDKELEDSVQKFGEGNWATILKGNFKGDRTPSQLSQRWATIRKRKNLSVESTKSSGSQLSEAQVEATRHAMSVALNMPSRKSGIGIKLPPLNLSHQASTTTVLAKSSPSSTLKPIIGSIKRSPPNPSLDPETLRIKAAAFAAGARIATPSDAASLRIAAQAKKAIHINPSRPQLIKCSVPGASSLRPGTFQISSGAGLSSSTAKTAPAKAGTRISEPPPAPVKQETVQKVETIRASGPNNVSQSGEDGACGSVKSTSKTVQKELESRDQTASESKGEEVKKIRLDSTPVENRAVTVEETSGEGVNGKLKTEREFEDGNGVVKRS